MCLKRQKAFTNQLHHHRRSYIYSQNNKDRLETLPLQPTQSAESDIRKRLGLSFDTSPSFTLRQARIVHSSNSSNITIAHKIYLDKVGSIRLNRGLDIQINTTAIKKRIFGSIPGPFQFIFDDGIEDTLVSILAA